MPVGKRPYRIRMEDESPFFVGGMWDVWHARETDALFTFTVLTTFPNEVSGMVHDQMRVIVQRKGLPALVGPGPRVDPTTPTTTAPASTRRPGRGGSTAAAV